MTPEIQGGTKQQTCVSTALQADPIERVTC